MLTTTARPMLLVLAALVALTGMIVLHIASLLVMRLPRAFVIASLLRLLSSLKFRSMKFRSKGRAQM